MRDLVRVSAWPGPHALTAALALLVVVAVIAPPEKHPWSGFACAVAASAALLCALRGRAGGLLPRWALGLLPFAALAMRGASSGARGEDAAAYAALLIVTGAAARRAGAEPRAERALAALLAIAGVAAALLAILQHHMTYPAEAAALRAIDPADATGVLVRLEAGRPAGPFLLPAALAGLLALALPLTLSWLVRLRAAGWVAAAAAGAAAQLYAVALTRSIGGLIACAAALLLVLPDVAPRRRRLATAAILAVGLAGAGLFLATRREEMRVPGSDPLSLRAGNWGAAARMIADQPFFGVGPGAFALHYPRYMRVGMNESRHAHNSYLEAMAEWGLWVMVPLGVLLVRQGRALIQARRARDAGFRLALLAGGAAFLLHNAGDFTAFLPGVALPAAVAIGLSARGAGGSRSRPALAWAAAAGMAVLLVWHALPAAHSRSLFDAARAAADAGEIDVAAGLARAAMSARPRDPDPHAFLAQLVLADRMHDGVAREEGERAAERAVALEPDAAVLHYTLALYRHAAGETAAAWLERTRARALFPMKPLYAAPPAAPGPGRP